MAPGGPATGYAAVGVDPHAPDEPGYHRVAFEDYRPPEPVNAVVACTSLHHVDDLDDADEQAAIDKVGHPGRLHPLRQPAALTAGGADVS